MLERSMDFCWKRSSTTPCAPDSHLSPSPSRPSCPPWFIRSVPADAWSSASTPEVITTEDTKDTKVHQAGQADAQEINGFLLEAILYHSVLTGLSPEPTPFASFVSFVVHPVRSCRRLELGQDP